jgi:transcriptional regulator with XRE-family HTH domain
MQALCDVSSNAGYAGDMQTGRPCDRPRPRFGERLHALREAKGLTQAQVAQSLDISARAYAFWEREPVAVRTEQLAILAKLFAVSVDALVGQDPPQPRGNGPAGKMRQLFDAASRLPRSQQQKIAAVLEPFILQHAHKA